jgi:hypothetical protein
VLIRKKTQRWHAALAGAIAGGLGIMLEKKARRVTIAQQLFVRCDVFLFFVLSFLTPRHLQWSSRFIQLMEHETGNINTSRRCPLVRFGVSFEQEVYGRQTDGFPNLGAVRSCTLGFYAQIHCRRAIGYGTVSF